MRGEWKREHHERCWVLDASGPGVQSLRSRVLGFGGCPGLRATQFGSALEKGSDQALAETLTFVGRGHPDFVDEHLRVLVRVDVVDTTCHAHNQPVLRDRDGKMMSRIGQELLGQTWARCVVEDIRRDVLEDRVLCCTEDSYHGHGLAFCDA